jgi:uncharacterized protein YneR
VSDYKKNILSALELGNESQCFISTATLCQVSNSIDDFEFNVEQKDKRIAELEAQSQWVSVEDELPKTKCIARYVNSHGNERTIMAEYIKQFTVEADNDCDSDGVSEYCEEKDTWYYKEGWWEVIDNWDDYHMVSVHQGEVTHWQALPTPPAKEQGS